MWAFADGALQNSNNVHLFKSRHSNSSPVQLILTIPQSPYPQYHKTISQRCIWYNTLVPYGVSVRLVLGHEYHLLTEEKARSISHKCQFLACSGSHMPSTCAPRPSQAVGRPSSQLLDPSGTTRGPRSRSNNLVSWRL